MSHRPNVRAQELAVCAANAALLMARRFGHELPERQLESLMDKLRELTREFELARVEDCLSLLHTLPLDAPLVQRLLERTTNKESYFFRDAATMDSLRTRILPELIAATEGSRTLRVWSAGCSTGEEIYTVNILLRELLPAYDDWAITLVGTDVDRTAIARAKRGVYGSWSLRAASQDATRAHFEPASANHFAIKARYRKNVSFATHNLADPHAGAPAPGRFDLILCRNVTIYFEPRAQATVASTFARALSPHGVWLAGPSDPMPAAGFRIDVLPGVLTLRNRADVTPSARDGIFEPTRSELMRMPAPPLGAPLTATQGALDAPLPRPVVHVNGEPVEAADARARDTLAQASALADQDKLHEARALVESLLARHKLWAEPYLLRAVLREAAGDLAGALKDLTRVLYLEPDHLEARLRLGLTFARMGETERALSSLRSAVAVPRSDEELAELRALAAQQLVRLMKKARMP